MTNEKIMSTICDSICRHPYRVESQAELDILCEDCVVNKLEASDSDLISRADAIEAVMNIEPTFDTRSLEPYQKEKDVVSAIESLPSASVEQTDCTDFVNWLLEEVMYEEMWELNAVANGEIICRKLKKLGLLEVKDGYYIRPSAEAVQGEWIPIKWHEITDEEREREGYPKDWVVYIDCEMPCDEQEILVQTKSGYIRWDVCYEDGEFSLDSGWDWIDDIVAWMPLPKPYEGSDDE